MIRKARILYIAASLALIAAALVTAAWVYQPQESQANGSELSLETAISQSVGKWQPYPNGLPRVSDASPGAVQFPRGVSYGEALTAIFVAQSTATVPSGARLVAPLPAGAVLMEEDGQVTIDLRAPYGYDTRTKMVHTGLVQMDGNLPADAVQRAIDNSPFEWPVGGRLAIPELPDCQVVQSRMDVPRDCGVDDKIVLTRNGPPLPAE